MSLVLVQTVTVGAGGVASIEFTGIPQDGTDLLLVVSARTSAASELGNMGFSINNLTTGVTERRLIGTGSAVQNSSGDSIVFYASGNNSTANTFGNLEIYLPNYSGSTAKSYSGNVVSENNGTTAAQVIIAGSQSSTSAVTSVKLAPWPSGTILQNSTASLYKITKA